MNILGTFEVAPGVPIEGAVQSECRTLHTSRDSVNRQPHVLFMIDELCEMGGGERVLLRMARMLPPELFRCSIITFKIDKSIEELKSLPCPLYVLPLGKTYDLNALATARRIREFIKREDISIVHTFFETSDLWGGLVSKLSGVPVLVSSRRDLGILRSRKHKVAYRLLGRLYDTVLAVSPQVRDFCIQQDGLQPGKVQVLFNGIDLPVRLSQEARSALRKAEGLPEGAPVVTTVANVRRVKGLDVLVRAAGVVCGEFPETQFVIVGEESETEHCEDLRQMVRASGLTRNFHFLGSREDVTSLLGMSDIFCLPSRSEGFSNALIEAMACSLPCVATDVGGNREALEDGKTGYLVGSEDWEMMGQKLVALLQRPLVARKMGELGRKVVEGKFTANAMMRDLVRLYLSLLPEGVTK